MGRRTHQLLLIVVIASVGVAGGFDAIAESCAGLAHVLPLVLLLVPLLTGRYVGEQQLARLAGISPPRPRRRRARPRAEQTSARAVPRGGCLIASFLAVRPPPGLSPATA